MCVILAVICFIQNMLNRVLVLHFQDSGASWHSIVFPGGDSGGELYTPSNVSDVGEMGDNFMVRIFPACGSRDFYFLNEVQCISERLKNGSSLKLSVSANAKDAD